MTDDNKVRKACVKDRVREKAKEAARRKRETREGRYEKSKGNREEYNVKEERRGT